MTAEALLATLMAQAEGRGADLVTRACAGTRGAGRVAAGIL